MRRRLLYGILALFGLVVIVGVGVIASIFLGGSEAASAPIIAPTIMAPTMAAGTNGPQLFQIVPNQSEVRFKIDEVLRGQPTTVVGRTNQVAGSISVDPAKPANSQVGVVRVDVRTLATDNQMRNRAIQRFILQSDQFEFVEFKPTALDGLPQGVTIGQPFSFRTTGDLTIRNVTHPVTFDVTVTPVSATQMKGTAAATVQRGEYNLVIPNVPGVANVAEDVHLEIDFVATAAGEGAGATTGTNQ